MGTDAHLQVQQLLSALPVNTPPEDLKTILCPLLAGSPEEQERFYTLFDQSWRRADAAGRALEEALVAPPPAFVGNLVWRKHLPRVMGWSGILLIGIIWWIASRPMVFQAVRVNDIVVEMGGDERDFCFPDSFGIASIDKVNICQKDTLDNVSIRFEKSQNSCLKFSPVSIGQDTICLEVTYAESEKRDTIPIIFNVVEKQAKAVALIEKPLPYLHNPEMLEMPENSAWKQWVVKNQWWMKALVALLLAWGLIALLRWRQRQRQKLIAEYEPKTRPPYVWNIAIGGEQDVTLNEEFYAALNQLRQRTGGDAWRLSVPKTVRATIEKGGKMAFRYEQQTRPPEYLLLIDRQSGRNHRAQLFNFMFKRFKANEVLAERYFFDGDPRLCWNDEHPEGVFVKDLSHKYYNARLLLLGNGYRLLSPISGKLAGWTNVLSGWRERAILTPEPPDNWGRREASLELMFKLAPSSVSATIQTLQYFETGETKTDNPWQAGRESAARKALSLEGNLMERLYFYFAEKDEVGRVTDDSLLQWIAACAVYPELHWDLTLHLGRLLTAKEADTPQGINLLTLDNLAQLTRLPWFVDGEIPAEARTTLLDWFGKQHPATLDAVRRSLHELLQKNPPPATSAAYDSYRMNLCLNEWLFTKDKKRKKELEGEIAGRQAYGHEADFTVAKILERQKTALDFILPERWKKFLRPKDQAFNQWTDLLWAIPLWLILSAGALLAPLKLPECSGNLVKVENAEWCIDSPEKELWLKEYYAFQFIRKQKLSSLDSLLKTIHPLVDANQLDTLPLYKNLTTGIYNQGVKLTEYQALMDTLMTTMTPQTGPQPEMNLQEFIIFMADMTGQKTAVTGTETLESIGSMMSEWLTKFKEGQLSSADSSRIFKLFETKGPAAFSFIRRIARDSSCALFQRAARMESSLPQEVWDDDILAAPNLACPQKAAQSTLPPESTPAQQAQQPAETQISGRIVDSRSGRSIDNAFVLNKANNQQFYSDYKGYFQSIYPEAAGRELELVVSKKGYENTTYTLAKENASKSMLIRLRLKDRDGDGVADEYDNCPDEQGEPKLGGCPPGHFSDKDGDGVPDRQDKCPDVAGDPKLGGCPPADPSVGNSNPAIQREAPTQQTIPSQSRRPAYKGCENIDRQIEERCTESKIGQFLRLNLKIPAEALKIGIQGTVNVSFVIEKDGSVAEITAQNDLGFGTAQEAIRVVKQLPKFNPGLNNAGEPVRVQYQLPVSFQLK